MATDDAARGLCDIAALSLLITCNQLALSRVAIREAIPVGIAQFGAANS